MPSKRGKCSASAFIQDARNQRSRGAIERIGGKFEGILRAHRMAADHTARDSARYSIVAAEWPIVNNRYAIFCIESEISFFSCAARVALSREAGVRTLRDDGSCASSRHRDSNQERIQFGASVEEPVAPEVSLWLERSLGFLHRASHTFAPAKQSYLPSPCEWPSPREVLQTRA